MQKKRPTVIDPVTNEVSFHQNLMIPDSSLDMNEIIALNQAQEDYFSTGVAFAPEKSLAATIKSLFSKLPTCPSFIPFCKRTACRDPSNNLFDLQSNAFSCHSVPGCCFDLELFYNQKIFGKYLTAPTCFVSATSSIFQKLADSVIPWKPESQNVLVEELQDYKTV